MSRCCWSSLYCSRWRCEKLTFEIRLRSGLSSPVMSMQQKHM